MNASSPKQQTKDAAGEAPGARPDYRATLGCPACGRVASHRVLRARQALPLPVPDHPFLRAFGWVEGFSRTEDSPLYYGVLLCPTCRYPGSERQFKPETDAARRNVKSIQRLFVVERIGTRGPMEQLIGENPDEIPQPERAARLLLAAIQAETLVYPGFWRWEEIGRLYLRLSWLYLDELHLDWSQGRPTSPPALMERGPGARRMTEVLDRLGSLRDSWPEIPLDEETARAGALRFYQEAFQRRSAEPAPEEAVAEERRLAELFGLTGRLEAAQEMFTRSLRTCDLLCRQERSRQAAAERDLSVPDAERQEPAVRVRRLSRLAEEIAEQRRILFGSATARAQPARPSAAASGRNRTEPRAPSRPKKRFGLFG